MYLEGGSLKVNLSHGDEGKDLKCNQWNLDTVLKIERCGLQP
jgi:hypothetical protein